jgi:hypothetical protein
MGVHWDPTAVLSENGQFRIEKGRISSHAPIIIKVPLGERPVGVRSSTMYDAIEIVTVDGESDIREMRGF